MPEMIPLHTAYQRAQDNHQYDRTWTKDLIKIITGISTVSHKQHDHRFVSETACDKTLSSLHSVVGINGAFPSSNTWLRMRSEFALKNPREKSVGQFL